MNRANRPRLSRITGSSYASRTMTRSGDGSTLALDFTTGVLDPRLTFTRSTNATFINSQGLVQWADANLVTGSELCDPTLYGWSQQLNPGYLFDTSVNDPFGNPGVPRITSNATSGSSAVNSSSFAVSAGLTYTLTFWVRAGTSTTFLAGIFDATAGAFVPASGTILSGPGSISGTGAIALTSLTSAWTKVRIYLTPANTAASRAISFYPQAAASGGQSNYLWGVQLNIGQTSNPAYFKTVATAYQAPRFDYDPSTLQPRGLLIEASSVNHVLRSNVTGFPSPWSTAGTNLPTVTAGYTGGGFSPDGITYPTRLQFGVNAGGSASRLLQATTYATNPTTANPYTVSVWMKSNTAGTNYTVNIYGTTGNNLVTVTPTWQRFQVVNTSGTSLVGYIYISNESTSIAADISIWGAQLEAGNGASSLIPTGASTGNRANESLYLDGASFAAFWPSGQSQYSVYFAGDITRSPATTQFLWLARTGSGGVGASRARSFVTSASSIRANTTVNDLVSGLNASTNTLVRTALGVSSGSCALSTNNGTTSAIVTNADTGLSTDAAQLVFNPNSDVFQHIKTLKYWPTRLSDAQLQALTT